MARIANRKRVMYLTLTEESLHIGLQMAPLRKKKARPGKVTAFFFAVVATEMKEASISFHTKMSVPIEVCEDSRAQKALIPLIGKRRTDVRLFAANPEGLNLAVSRWSHLRHCRSSQ